MAGYIAVKNFERFQHYKDRNPPWIKLYNELLDDYDFGRLPDASKWLAVGIWLLASRYDNRVPNDPEWIGRRINANTPVNLAPLLTSGFITTSDGASGVLAGCAVSATPETEGEGEGETEEPLLADPADAADGEGKQPKEKPPPKRRRPFSIRQEAAFNEFWTVYPARPNAAKRVAAKRWNARMVEKVDPAEIVAGATRYAAYIKARGQVGTEYVKQAATFLGPDEHWKEPWGAPTQPVVSLDARRVAQWVHADGKRAAELRYTVQRELADDGHRGDELERLTTAEFQRRVLALLAEEVAA